MNSDVPADVLWHEGMLLSPQHFQQSALRFERLLQYRLWRSAPFSYGVHSIAFDQSALTGGFLRLTQLEAVMPDGLVVKLPAGEQADLSFDLTPLIAELRQEPMRVLLAVPHQQTGSASQASGGDLPRMRASAGEDTIDLTSGLGGVHVGRQIPNLRLLVTRQNSRKFVTMPIAEVACRDEAFELTRYVPPQMLFQRGTPLAQECELISRRQEIVCRFIVLLLVVE